MKLEASLFNPPAADLLQLYGPVGIVQELLPASVTLVAEVRFGGAIRLRRIKPCPTATYKEEPHPNKRERIKIA